MDFKDMAPNEEEVTMMGREDEEAPVETVVEETPVEETVKEEPVAEPTPEPVKEEPVPVVEPAPKMVPLAALHEAREELRKFREKLSIVDEVKKQLDEVRAQKEQANIPKYEEDPLGNLDHRIKQEQAKKVELEQKLQQFEQHQQVQVMAHHVTSLENDFRKTTPDYDKALDFVLGIKKAEIELMGITDPDVINQEVAKIANSFSITALNQGKNPAEMIYGIAQKYGYSKPTVKAPVAQLEAVKQAQAVAGKTLSKGGEIDAPASATALASEKFNIFDPNFDKKWKELFGE